MTISRAAPFVLLLGGAVSAQAEPPPITWHAHPFADSLAQARASRKPVLVYFWMDGSKHCGDLWNETLAKPDAHELLRAFVCHSAKATEATGRDLIRRYHVKTLPSLVVVQPDGALDDVVLGYVPPAQFRREIQRVLTGTQTVSALRAAAAAAPTDLNRRFALAQKLRFVGDTSGSDQLIDSIRKDDPEGATAPGAEVLLFDLRQRIIDTAPDQADVGTWKLEPIYDRLRKTRQTAVRFKGYGWLAKVHAQRGERKLQREAWQFAWPHVPPTQASGWGGEVLLAYWNQREDALSTKDRRLARAIAKHLLDEIDGDDGASNAELVAFRLRCAACGLAVAGKLSQARKLIARAVELQPNDGELTTLAEQLAK